MGILTIPIRCLEVRMAAVRASGSADASVTVQEIDRVGASGSDPVIRRFLRARQGAEG